MLIIGLCQGMQPIVGYNFGAHHYDRVEKVFKKTVTVATIISTCGFLLALFTPKLIVSAFTTDETLTAIATHGLRISMLCFPIVGFQIVTTNLFQSIGMAWKAIFLSLSRQVLFLLPMVWLLPNFLELNGVWMSPPTADLTAGIVSAFFLVYQWKRFQASL